MQTFGISADVDAMSHKRRVDRIVPVESKAAVGRRAAQYRDIVDIPERKHFQDKADRGNWQGVGVKTCASASSRGLETVDIDACRRRRPMAEREKRKAAGGVLPLASATYDMLTGAKAGHRFFDGICRAQQYAELIGRPDAEGVDADMLRGALLELTEGQQMPLTYRRVLESMLPATSHPDFRGMNGEDLREVVSRRVAERCAIVPQSSVGELTEEEEEEEDFTPKGVADVHFEGASEPLLDDEFAMGSESLEEHAIIEAILSPPHRTPTTPLLSVATKPRDTMSPLTAYAMALEARAANAAMPGHDLPRLLGSPRGVEQQAIWKAEKTPLKEQ